MSEFGALLREQRQAKGWRQRDLVDALAGGLARSTIANVEAGREPPSARLWQLVREHLPEWESVLAESYAAVVAERAAKSSETTGRSAPEVAGHRASRLTSPDQPVLGGAFAIEQLTLVYVFKHSRAPEEILEIRRVRALRNGADQYGLKLAQSESSDFTVDEEALFGGHIATAVHHRTNDRTIYHRSFIFDRTLRRGQTHEFAVRSWIDHDPDPGTDVQVGLTVPVQRVAIHLNFHGPAKPTALWSYGPVADDTLVPSDAADAVPLPLGPGDTASLYLNDPQTGPTYGIGWRW